VHKHSPAFYVAAAKFWVAPKSAEKLAAFAATTKNLPRIELPPQKSGLFILYVTIFDFLKITVPGKVK
jgi:hypothetical protein